MLLFDVTLPQAAGPAKSILPSSSEYYSTYILSRQCQIGAAPCTLSRPSGSRCGRCRGSEKELQETSTLRITSVLLAAEHAYTHEHLTSTRQGHRTCICVIHRIWIVPFVPAYQVPHSYGRRFALLHVFSCPPKITVFVNLRDSIFHILGRVNVGLRVASRMLTYLDSLCEAGVRRSLHSLPAVSYFALQAGPGCLS